MGIDASVSKDQLKRLADREHAACPTELSDEPAAGLEGGPDSGDHAVGIADPVQGGVAKNGIEHAIELQVSRVDDTSIETALECRPDLLRAGVDGHDLAPGCDEALRQRAVAAPQVQYLLSVFRVQKVDNGSAKVGHEPCVSRVLVWVPGLHTSPTDRSRSRGDPCRWPCRPPRRCPPAPGGRSHAES